MNTICIEKVEQALPNRSEEPQVRASSGLDQEEFEVLVKTAREFGSKYGRPFLKAETTFTEAFTQNVDDFIRLRGMFPVQGSHRTRLVANKEYTWAAFCQEFLGITSDYFGRLVRKLRPKPKAEPQEPEANGDEDKQELVDTSLTDAFAYFAAYKKDPAAFAAELRNVVLHFGLERKISVVALLSEKVC